MPKAPIDNYLEEISLQRSIWARKPVLKALYHEWYESIVLSLAPTGPVVEIGSGCGNFKEFYPECIATDVFQSGPWIDKVMDAHNITFEPETVGNFVAFDVIHHLQRPLNLLRQCSAALKEGGRLILCEPAATPWARLVYGTSHHEGIDFNWDLFGLDGTPPDSDPGHMFANMAIPEILFWRQRKKTLEIVPNLSLIKAKKFGFLLYPLTGGFNYRSFVPFKGFSTLIKAENTLMRPFANWLSGMRMLVVLEKQSSNVGERSK